MTPEEAREKRESILAELTAKWHARDCGCPAETCPVATASRRQAEELMQIAAIGLRKRGWF